MEVSTMEKYTIEEVFNLLGKDALMLSSISRSKRTSIEVNGFKVYRQSLRYATFFQKGCKCVCCGREGTYFQLDHGDNAAQRRHFNLYTADGVLMTKDHILPKALGGRDVISNMQTMCVYCNGKKAANY
jgi:5-methylcytosine-specific restriction endonuclease McrA